MIVGMEEKKHAPVGVFDSGVGGLTVAREIMRQLPGENVVFRRHGESALREQVKK